MLDENGSPPLADPAPAVMSGVPSAAGGLLLAGGFFALYGMTLLQVLSPGGVLVAGGASLLGLGCSHLRWRSRKRRHFEAARRQKADRARQEATAAGTAGDGLVRVRGPVKVLEPVAGPDGTGQHGAWQTLDARSCGRVAVVEGAITAIVDDDCFEVWGDGAFEAGGMVGDGSQVEVVGRAVKGAADPDVATLSAGGYRGDSSVLVFAGSQDDPVRIFLT